MKVKDIIALYKFNSVFDKIRVYDSSKQHEFCICFETIQKMEQKEFMNKTVETVTVLGGSLTIITKGKEGSK